MSESLTRKVLSGSSCRRNPPAMVKQVTEIGVNMSSPFDVISSKKIVVLWGNDNNRLSARAKFPKSDDDDY